MRFVDHDMFKAHPFEIDDITLFAFDLMEDLPQGYV